MTPPTEALFHPVQTHDSPRALPEAVALKAYEVYCHVFSEQPAMMDVARGCRGGFSISEYIAFLYASSFPKHEWRARMKEALVKPKEQAQ